ncbi:exocyst subunit, partial [Spiromyces aspiralis]
AQRKILDEIIDKYNALSIQCLVVLRIELRISCIYHLDLATREGEYNIGRSEIEPDRYIQILNSKLALYQEKMYIILSDDELNFVFGGISILMAHMLIVNTRHIREFNSYGAEKMIRNVLSLQQNLTNIALSGESGLDRARKFYELYLFGVDGILRHIANEGPNFSFDEYKVLIDFTYQHMLAQPSTEVGAAIDEVGESGVASLPPYESTISTLKQLFNVA